MKMVRAKWWNASSAVPVVVAVAVGALVTSVTWLRMLPLARETVWADDSTRFLGETIRLGLVDSLFIPYGGYLQVVPRVGGWLALHIGGFDDLARHTTAVSCVFAGIVGALVYLLSRQNTTSSLTAVLLGCVAAFVPAIPAETAGNLANLHWYALAATPFLFVHRPKTWTGSAGLAACTLVFALSETQMAVFLPLLLVGIRSRKKLPVVAAAVLGLVAQFATLLSAPRTSHRNVPVALLDIVQGYLLQPFAGTWTNHSDAVGSAVTGAGWWVVVVPFVVVLVVVAAAMWRGRPVQRIMLGAMIWGSAASWAAPIIVTPSTGFLFSRYTASQYGAFHVLRYTAIASLFIMLGLLIAADMLLDSLPGRITAAGVVLVLVVAAVTNWHTPWTGRMAGPAWSPQIPALQEQCAGKDPQTQVQVQVAPNANWALTAPCAYLQP